MMLLHLCPSSSFIQPLSLFPSVEVMIYEHSPYQVRPGIVSKTADGKVQCRPIFSQIVSLFAEQNELEYAVPGGLIGVGTRIDPTLCRLETIVFYVFSKSPSLQR